MTFLPEKRPYTTKKSTGIVKKSKNKDLLAKKVLDEPVWEKLMPRQEKFCQLYTGESSFFGNGVQAYLQVYDIDRTKAGWYKTACAAASQILSNVKVCNRINSLLEWAWLSKELMDKQLLFIATQHNDLGNKLGAIKEYNRITRRIEDNPAPVTNAYVVDEAKLQRFRDMKKKFDLK